jgi:signal transduction histidine kinase
MVKAAESCYDGRMKKAFQLEPGLLSIFRSYVFVRTLALMLTGMVMLGLAGVPFGKEILLTAGLYLVEAMFLLAYLYWPWGHRKLGRWYLPIAVFVAAASPIVQMRYLLSFSIYNSLQNLDLWLIFPFLTVPLILTAWQYTFREVLIYCLGTTLLEMWTLRFLSWTREVSTWPDAGNLIARVVFLMAIGYIVSYLASEQRRQRHELAAANRKLIRNAMVQEELATIRERNRLARELHDTLAHTLSGLTVQLDALTSIWQPGDEKAERILVHALDTARTGLDETRRALKDLRAAPLEDMGLAMALRRLVESTTLRGSLQLNLDVPEDVGNLPSEVEQMVYRIAQEALENVLRHADAGTVSLSLRFTDGRLVLCVSDDGRGFAGDRAASEERIGLRVMRERAALIGGTLSIETRPGEGTGVELVVPLTEAQG